MPRSCWLVASGSPGEEPDELGAEGRGVALGDRSGGVDEARALPLVESHDLYRLALSDLLDERIAHAFQKAALPTELVGELQALVREVHSPLAVRSSSLLEDALGRPFAGVYAT